MLSQGICMTSRNFTCLVCQRLFSRVTQDVIIYDDMICDECLAELCLLDGEALARRVVEKLAWKNPRDKELESGIVSAIQRCKPK